MSEADEITRRARSNLAFALRVLPPERRADAVVFYAFCRTVDDLADDAGCCVEERRAALSEWREGLLHGFADESGLRGEMAGMLRRQGVPAELPAAVVDGCLQDLEPRIYETREELDAYIWKVACAVGLVSIRLFGCADPGAAGHAEALGRALQLTNILRDVGEDLGRGRIYLPRAEMSAHGLAPEDLGRPVLRDDPRLLSLFGAVADRAEEYYLRAERLAPAGDWDALLPARIMAEIYRTLLRRMRADRFRVFGRRYSLSHARKLAILSKHLIARRPRVE